MCVVWLINGAHSACVRATGPVFATQNASFNYYLKHFVYLFFSYFNYFLPYSFQDGSIKIFSGKISTECLLRTFILLIFHEQKEKIESNTQTCEQNTRFMQTVSWNKKKRRIFEPINICTNEHSISIWKNLFWMFIRPWENWRR